MEEQKKRGRQTLMAINRGASLVMSLYSGFIMVLLGYIIITTLFGQWFEPSKLLAALMKVSQGVEVVLMVVYLFLKLALSDQGYLQSSQKDYRGVATWKIFAFWEHFHYIIRECLVWNGLVIALLLWVK